jgi:hypothetical protein
MIMIIWEDKNILHAFTLLLMPIRSLRASVSLINFGISVQLFLRWAYLSIMKNEAAPSSETSTNIHQTTRRHILKTVIFMAVLCQFTTLRSNNYITGRYLGCVGRALVTLNRKAVAVKICARFRKEDWENKVRWINEYRVQQNLLGTESQGTWIFFHFRRAFFGSQTKKHYTA